MRLWAEPTSTICAPPLRPDRNSLSAQRVQIAGPALEEVPHCWDTCFWGGQVLVAEAGQFLSICANMRCSKPGSTRAAWSKRSSLEKCCESSKTSARSRASARSNSARTLRVASSSVAKVGPIRLAVAGWPGVRVGVQSEVDEQVVVAVDDDPTESRPRLGSARCSSLSFGLPSRGRPWRRERRCRRMGEEVEVLGGPCG